VRAAAGEVHVVVPAGVDDPARPSGGNVYDRRLCASLVERGWRVREHHTTSTVPDGALALVDGLLTGPALVEEAERLRVVVLVHAPHGPEVGWEAPVLRAAAAVITTSRWTRRRLLDWYALPPERVRVAEPGVDPVGAEGLAPGTAGGGALLSVGAVTPTKGYDVLAAALGLLGDLEWSCRGVGSTEVAPAFAATVGPTVHLIGPLARPELAATYVTADLLVLASRAESYGMVVTEALARGLPVVATDVGGVRESLGRRGGVLVPPEDPPALAAALRRWLTDPEHRAALRVAARQRGESLGDWRRTAALVAGALREAV
jgi:glycosyltransferase involved in cell wall biosynthesis